MKFTSSKLRDILVSPGYIAESDFKLIEKEAKESNLELQNLLIQRGLIKNEHLGKLIAEELKLKFIDLKETSISEDVITIVPELVARNQLIIAFERSEKGIKLASANPDNLDIIELLKRKTGEEILLYYATPADIRASLKYYRKDLKKTFDEIISEQANLVKKNKNMPIIKMVDTIIRYAYENRASDIHIGPLEKKIQIRFRIDGILHNVLSLPKEIHGLIVTRVKVLAKLRTDEHFAAQDGKFASKLGKEKFDIRVSIVPVTEGENMVMRILSEKARKLNLEDLGLLGKDLEKVSNAVKKPYGMILSTGPTGCGKTTTLYSILKILNKPKVNICTIEDPVEYDIEGVSQIQVNNKTDLTFSNGLRSVVRQDPDIIMVGEVRDEETASIAINSAMTGHLVLSSMHANTAATNLPRLIDMGIEPFLAASSVNIIIAQRLVRKICVKCRESFEITKADCKKMNMSDDSTKKFLKGKTKMTCYHGKGCKDCSETGYVGRIGIFEVLEMMDDIKKLVMSKANAAEIQKQAIKNGMTTMIEDGFEKVRNGTTTIEEVLRVIKE